MKKTIQRAWNGTLRWIRNAFGLNKVEITWGAVPSVKFFFDKKEILELGRTKLVISRVLNDVFVGRRVFQALTYGEHPAWIALSLQEARTELDDAFREISERSDVAASGYAKIIGGWKIHIKRACQYFESLGEARYDPTISGWFEELNRIRLNSIPYATIFSKILDDDDPVKLEALNQLKALSEYFANKGVTVDLEMPGSRPS